MVENLTKYVQLLSVLAVVAISVFNIGFFWDIGLHLMGIIDFSNLVYSFGLTFVFLVIIFPILNWVEKLTSLSQKPDAVDRFDKLLRKYSKVYFGVFVLLFLLGMFHAGLSLGEVTTLGALTAFIAVMLEAFVSYKASGTLSTNRMVLLLVLGLGTVFCLGQTSAYRQTFSIYSYTVTTKNSPPLEKARLVRSSSSGFIVSIVSGDKNFATIRFIPIGEIKEITADLPQFRW
jgi:hypothetical protein